MTVTQYSPHRHSGSLRGYSTSCPTHVLGDRLVQRAYDASSAYLRASSMWQSWCRFLGMCALSVTTIGRKGRLSSDNHRVPDVPSGISLDATAAAGLHEPSSWVTLRSRARSCSSSWWSESCTEARHRTSGHARRPTCQTSGGWLERACPPVPGCCVFEPSPSGGRTRGEQHGARMQRAQRVGPADGDAVTGLVAAQQSAQGGGRVDR